MKLLAATLLLISAFSVTRAWADDQQPVLEDLMICAVYFRMNVGALRFARDLSPLADMEEEKMSRLMARARQDAVSEFGEQRAESEFQRLWKANFQDMTDTINRNYDNIGQLKMMYDRRCELMADS